MSRGWGRFGIARAFGASVLLAALLTNGCGAGDPIRDVELLFRVDVGAEVVEPGQAFPLTVTRIWRRDLDVAPWDARVLAPLRLEATSLETRDDGVHVEEVRHFRAYAFTLKDVRIPAPRFVAQTKGADGAPRVARADTIRLRVRPTVDPADPGAPEVPGPLPPAPSPVWPLVALGLALGVGLAVGLWRRRRPAERAPVPVVEDAPPVAPDVVALTRLAAIGARADGDFGRDGVEVSAVVRDYAGARYDVSAWNLTTEELVARVGSAGPALLSVLRRCDGVKFAGQALSDRARDALLDAAASFVRETS